MKAVLICPSDRPGVSELAVQAPLVATSLLGRTVLEWWIDDLVARGIRDIVVLASDRPAAIRELAGSGARWGAHLDIVPAGQEPTVEEARARYGADCEIHTVDHLPGAGEMPLFESYAACFGTAKSAIANAAAPWRIGVRELKPGVWAGLRATIAHSARLTPPCWIGDYSQVGPDTQIGPNAFIDNCTIVDEGARIIESMVGPGTYVGKFVSVERSIAAGRLLINWFTNSALQVPDPFLLAGLSERRSVIGRPSFASRTAAALAMVATAPVAACLVAVSVLRGEAPWQLRLAMRSRVGRKRSPHDTFAYYELSGARTWLRRWPQFWNVVRGEMHWMGNRPLSPAQALTLANDFERLWLAAPVGIISLADAHGCPDGLSDEAIGHGSFYAVNASRRLDWQILSRCVLRSALIWPIPGRRRKEASMPLQELVHKQEI